MKWPFAARSRFARNVWQVARANVAAQALPVLAAPLLTRLVAPADFGALALFASWLGLALAVATARFDWSVPNARSTRGAAAVLVLGALALGACTLLVAVLVGALPRPAALGAALWLLVPVLLGSGLQQLMSAWHVRGAELGAVGRAKVWQSAGNVGVSLALALLLPAGQGLWALLLGLLAGAWIGIGPLWRSAGDLQRALRAMNRRRLQLAWRRYAGEAGWSTCVSLVNAASFAVVPLLLARHYGAAEVGFYALMQRVALGPVGLVGSAVSQSFWAEAARLVREDRAALTRLYTRSSVRLAWIALPLALLAAAGPLYVGPIFGAAQWQPAGWVLAASVPMLVGQVVVSPLSHLIIHRKQHWQALWDLVRIALLAAVIEAMGRAGAGFAFTVSGLSLAMGAMYVVLVLLNLRALKSS